MSEKRREVIRSTDPTEAVVRAAVKWVELRDECKELRKRCAAFECEEEYKPSERYPGEMERVGDPCWKQKVHADFGGGLMPNEDLCEACLHREMVRYVLHKTNARRGAYQRVLIQAVRRMKEKPDLRRGRG